MKARYSYLDFGAIVSVMPGATVWCTSRRSPTNA